MIDIINYINDPKGKQKPLKVIILDSLIVSIITFLSTLPQDRLPTLLDLYVALKSFLMAFALQLAIERGLKPRRYKRKH